jgi:hypothetical protein
MFIQDRSPNEKTPGADRAPRRSATAPGDAVRGPMTHVAMLALQRSVGNQAVARWTARDEHVHGPGCEHGAVQSSDPAEQSRLLTNALAAPGSPIESGRLEKAQSFYQNKRLSAARMHTGSAAQRAVEAFGARAITVGTDVLFGAGADRDPETFGHELGHVDKNTRGIAESGADNGAGVPVTHPGQGSERTAAQDGREYAKGGKLAPSVAAQRAVATDAGAGTEAEGGQVQRYVVVRPGETGYPEAAE